MLSIARIGGIFIEPPLPDATSSSYYVNACFAFAALTPTYAELHGMKFSWAVHNVYSCRIPKSASSNSILLSLRFCREMLRRSTACRILRRLAAVPLSETYRKMNTTNADSNFQI